MSDLETTRAAREVLRQTGEMLRPTRYGEAVNRYLGAAVYHDLQHPAYRPVRPVPPAPKRTGLVVVGVDDSPDSYVALDHAAIEAELHGWDLRMVHVQHGGGPKYPARDRGARLLERLTARVHARSGVVAVTSRLETGVPAATLLAAAGGADLVVVGRRHGAAGAAFGLTVGDRVAAHHRGSVLVVRMPGWPPGPEFVGRPIVAGVDDSAATASPVVDFALAEARVRGCDVVLLHADDGSVPADRMDTVDGVTVHHRRSGTDRIGALVAASEKAAAVVVLRHGRVSRLVVQHAYCPVFLVG